MIDKEAIDKKRLQMWEEFVEAECPHPHIKKDQGEFLNFHIPDTGYFYWHVYWMCNGRVHVTTDHIEGCP